MTEVSITCRERQRTGFYITGTSVMKELITQAIFNLQPTVNKDLLLLLLLFIFVKHLSMAASTSTS